MLEHRPALFMLLIPSSSLHAFASDIINSISHGLSFSCVHICNVCVVQQSLVRLTYGTAYYNGKTNQNYVQFSIAIHLELNREWKLFRKFFGHLFARDVLLGLVASLPAKCGMRPPHHHVRSLSTTFPLSNEYVWTSLKRDLSVK